MNDRERKQKIYDDLLVLVAPVLKEANGESRTNVMAALIELVVGISIVNGMPVEAFDFEVAMARDAFAAEGNPATKRSSS